MEKNIRDYLNKEKKKRLPRKLKKKMKKSTFLSQKELKEMAKRLEEMEDEI